MHTAHSHDCYKEERRAQIAAVSKIIISGTAMT